MQPNEYDQYLNTGFIDTGLFFKAAIDVTLV